LFLLFCNTAQPSLRVVRGSLLPVLHGFFSFATDQRCSFFTPCLPLVTLDRKPGGWPRINYNLGCPMSRGVRDMGLLPATLRHVLLALKSVRCKRVERPDSPKAQEVEPLGQRGFRRSL